MRRFIPLLAIPLLGALALVTGAAPALQPTPTVNPNFMPMGTPDAGVQVIPFQPESTVDALINEGLLSTPGPTPDLRTGQLPPGFLSPGTTAIVTANRLNVRAQPNTNADTPVLLQLSRGADVTVLQLNFDTRWALVDTRGPDFVQGWVSTAFISPFEEFITPFAPGLPDAAETGFTLRARQTVNIRQGPVLFSPRVGILPAGGQAVIVGVTNTYSWWKIEVDGTVGWVSGSFVFVEDPNAYGGVPIITN